MTPIELINNLLDSKKCCDLLSIVKNVESHLCWNTVDMASLELVDLNFWEQIQNVNQCTDINVYFGKTLRDIKCTMSDSNGMRQHELIIKYVCEGRLRITDANFPDIIFQNKEFSNLEDVIQSFKKCIESLNNYFYELDRIDQLCTVVDPVTPTFKEDYRKILIDSRTWLHLEVSKDGLATNIHLVGQNQSWQEKLQIGLLNWDHDKDIVENLMIVFDLTSFPKPELNSSLHNEECINEHACSICLCSELADQPGIPQPLCHNKNCGVYFHRNCLFQWLVACSGGRPPPFGVANGTCPSCLQPVTCGEKED